MTTKLTSILAFMLLSASFLHTDLYAQCIETPNGRYQFDGSPCSNTISTALPFLRITPNARNGALGDVGIALDPDANSMYFNASNLAFAPSDVGISATYTPWLRALGLSDMYLAYLSGYKNLDKFQTIGASVRFFSLGQVQYTDDQGNNLQTVRPREFELALAYARKLSDRFSTALTLKYIYSSLGSGGTAAGGDVMRPANAFAADLSFTYKQPLKFNNGKTGKVAVGLALSNLGSKVSYTQSANKEYIPANFGIGTSFQYDIDEHNSITFAVDITKLMVPTPVPSVRQEEINGVMTAVPNPDYDKDGNGIADYQEKSVPSSIFSSFGDASFGEEIRELMYSFGIEYWYNKQFAVRLGHYNEHKTKGNRKYITAGLGIKYNVFTIDFSYLIPTFNSQRNPLDNTLRFSLMMDFGESKANPKKNKPKTKEQLEETDEVETNEG